MIANNTSSEINTYVVCGVLCSSLRQFCEVHRGRLTYMRGNKKTHPTRGCYMGFWKEPG